MGGKKGKQISTGLTPMMNRSRIGDQTSHGDTHRKRTASAKGDRQREEETSPSKKSTDRPRRQAKDAANAIISQFCLDQHGIQKRTKGGGDSTSASSSVLLPTASSATVESSTAEGKKNKRKTSEPAKVFSEEELARLEAAQQSKRKPWSKKKKRTSKKPVPPKRRKVEKKGDEEVKEVNEDEEKEEVVMEEDEVEVKEMVDEGTITVDEELLPPPRIVVEGQESGEELEWDEEEIIVLRAGEQPDQRPPRMRKKGPEDGGEAPSSLAAALTSSAADRDLYGKRSSVCSSPRGTLLCREAECAQIKEFIRAAIAPNGSSQACYISGVPGTGKTASVMAMVEEVRAAKGCRPFVFLRANAVCCSSSTNVYTEILMEYLGQKHGFNNARRLSGAGAVARKRLNALFGSVDRERPPVLLLVDELDQLSTKERELIYDVFNWSAVEAARVSIISIANTLDLPERMLNQRICSRLGMNRIVFQPYTHAEIERIVLAKLGGTSDRHEDAIIDPQVVEIAARKAANSGDIRMALWVTGACIESQYSKMRVTYDQANYCIPCVMEVICLCSVRSLSRHPKMVFDAAVDIVRTRDVSDFSMADLVEKYESMMMVHEETPMNYHGVEKAIDELSSRNLVRFTNPAERSLFRRRLRLLPAVHDAVFALQYASC